MSRREAPPNGRRRGQCPAVPRLPTQLPGRSSPIFQALNSVCRAQTAVTALPLAPRIGQNSAELTSAIRAQAIASTPMTIASRQRL